MSRTRTDQTRSAGNYGRPGVPPADRVGLDDPFEALPRPLAEDLADLYGLPGSAVDAILQTLPFGYRATLEGLGCVKSDGPEGALRLTERGLQVIAQSHREFRNQPQEKPLPELRRELRDSLARIREGGDRTKRS